MPSRPLGRSPGRSPGALLLAALILGAVGPALACPVCDSETGRQVWAGIFDERFLLNLLLTALPFAIFFALAGAVHVGAVPFLAGRVEEP